MQQKIAFCSQWFWRRLRFFLLGIVALLSLQGCSKMATPDFQHITLPKTPNYYLVCPQSYCNVTPSQFAPVYPVSAEDLFAAFNQVIAKQQRVNFVSSIPEQGQYLLVDRSLVFNLPDDIAVQFIALSEDSSTLAIYSKSRYGFYDFDTNKRRIITWLQQLNQEVAVVAATPAETDSAQTQEQEETASTTATEQTDTTAAAPAQNVVTPPAQS